MASQFSGGYALLIAVNENRTSGWSLPDVIKDVNALRETLIDPDRCAYHAENVKVLSGRESTREGILRGLKWLDDCLKSDGSQNTTAFLYYTGHGSRDSQASPPAYYFIPYDVDQSDLRSSALSAVDFSAAVRALAPRRLLTVLDCCHAGGMGVKDPPSSPGIVPAAAPPDLLQHGPPNEERSLASKGITQLAQGTGRATLSSSRGAQSSYIRSDRCMSVFTYHLIEALTGHAQPAPGATDVLVSDVMSHVSRMVPQTVWAQYQREQEPDFEVSGNFPVALLLGGKGLQPQQPPPSPLGHAAPALSVTIQDDHSRRGDTITVGDVTGNGIGIGRNISVSIGTTAPVKDD